MKGSMKSDWRLRSANFLVPAATLAVVSARLLTRVTGSGTVPDTVRGKVLVDDNTTGGVRIVVDTDEGGTWVEFDSGETSSTGKYEFTLNGQATYRVRVDSLTYVPASGFADSYTFTSTMNNVTFEVDFNLVNM